MVVPVGLLALIGIAAPASAQFEAPLEVGEDFDSIDIAVTTDGDEWWVAERDGQVSTAPLGGPRSAARRLTSPAATSSRSST